MRRPAAEGAATKLGDKEARGIAVPTNKLEDEARRRAAKGAAAKLEDEEGGGIKFPSTSDDYEKDEVSAERGEMPENRRHLWCSDHRNMEHGRPLYSLPTTSGFFFQHAQFSYDDGLHDDVLQRVVR